MKLTIPGEFPTLNQYIAAERGNAGRYKAARMKRSATKRVACAVWAVTDGYPMNHMGGRVHVRCTWFRRNRRTDPDNVAAFGTKVLVDGLVEAGILEDDRWANIASIEHRFVVDRENPRVEVELEEVE